MKIGPFGSALKKEFYTKSGYKVYAQENVFTENFFIGDYYISKAKYDELSSCKLEPGDLVISMMGTIGSCAIFPENAEIGIMNSHLLRLQFKENIKTEYIYQLLKNSPQIRKQIKHLSVGSIMNGLSSSVVKKIFFPIPEFPEQCKIAKFLDLIDQRIQTQSKIIEDLESQIKWIKYNYFASYGNANEYYFRNLFTEYKKVNTQSYKQYTIGKYGIKEIKNDNKLYSIDKHIVFEFDTLILGIGIDEIGVSGKLIGCCSPIYKTYSINNKQIDACWFYYFANMYFNKHTRFITQKSTRREFEFDYKALNTIKFNIPPLDIQKKHFNILSVLQDGIDKEKDILMLYKKQKEYLLKNMFI